MISNHHLFNFQIINFMRIKGGGGGGGFTTEILENTISR